MEIATFPVIIVITAIYSRIAQPCSHMSDTTDLGYQATIIYAHRRLLLCERC